MVLILLFNPIMINVNVILNITNYNGMIIERILRMHYIK